MTHKRINYNRISTLLGVILVLLMLFNYYTLYSIKQALEDKTDNTNKLNNKLNNRTSLVNVVLISDKSCKECITLLPFVKTLKQLGVIINESSLDIASKEGRLLTSKYNIQYLPAMILSKEFGEYVQFASRWDKYGYISEDGSYVTGKIQPPYKDLSDGKIYGLVKLTHIIDSSCKECYNVSVHKQILTEFGIVFDKEETYDYNTKDGKALAEKYKITQIPTIIMSKDASEYTLLGESWSSVGTIAVDGSFIFRKIDVLESAYYKDTTTGEIRLAGLN